MIYNKVNDIYHTSSRIISHIKDFAKESITIKEVLIVDFLACFPQYRKDLSRRRGLGFLKSTVVAEEYEGSKSSHQFLLERSHWGAYKMLQAKSIITLHGDAFEKGELFNSISKSINANEIKKLCEYVAANGVDKVNESLNLFEMKYNVKS